MTNETPLPLTFAFVLLAATVAALAAWAAARAPVAAPVSRPLRVAPRWLAAAAIAGVWMAVWALVARTGALLRFDHGPPPMVFMMLATLAAGVAVGASPLGARLSRLPLAALVGFQAFRLPLELVMDRAARAGVMPVQMSFEGWNFDIVTGASALVVAALLLANRAPRLLVVAWNVLGVGLLVNIVAIAIASTPLLHAFGTAPGAVNTWIGTAPFVWLPTVFVSLAIAGHIVLTRRLLADAQRARSNA